MIDMPKRMKDHACNGTLTPATAGVSLARMLLPKQERFEAGVAGGTPASRTP